MADSTPVYSSIPNPYNTQLARQPDPYDVQLGGVTTNGTLTPQQQSLLAQAGGNSAASSTGAGGSTQQTSVGSGGAMSDLVITNTIQSQNWAPKTTGFKIDGQTGYAEFANIFLSGKITATTGFIGGWVVSATTLVGGGVTLDSTGIIDVGTGNNIVVLSAADANYRLWVGNAVAASAPFSVTKTGAVAASNITITGGSVAVSTLSGVVSQANLNIANQGWTQTMVFSAASSTQVNWSSGTFTDAGGTAYSITSGNTGAMAAKTYIYLDIVASTTALQITTTAANSVGNGRVLIAVAQNNTTEAIFQVFGGNGGVNIDASVIVPGSVTANEIANATITGTKIAASTIVAGNIAASTITGANIAANTITAGNITAATITTNEIAANTITANNIAASTITAAKMNVTQLSAIAADLGTINAGSITINSGVSSINTTGDAVFKSISVGGSTRQYTLNDFGVFSFGDGSDGSLSTSGDVTLTADKYYTDLTINPGHTLDPAGYRIFGNGTLTVNGSISGAGTAGSNGSNGVVSSGGAGGAGGLALDPGYLKGSVAGATGGAGGSGTSTQAIHGGCQGTHDGTVGSNGATTNSSLGVNGVSGASGGGGGSGFSCGSGGGGGGGTGGTANAPSVKLIANWHLATLLDIGASGSTNKFENSAGSSGGGGGGGGAAGSADNTTGGGGGGGGGGGTSGRIIAIYFRNILVNTLGAPGSTFYAADYAGTGADDSSIGTPVWSSPSAATGAPDGLTSNIGFGIGSTFSHYLKMTNYGFSLPSSTVVTGIKVTVRARGDGFGGRWSNFWSVKLVKGGSISGSDYAAGSMTSGSFSDFTFGGATDLWGQSWLYSDINASNFGVAISAVDANGNGSNSYVDSVQISIYITGGLIISNGGAGGAGGTGGTSAAANTGGGGGGAGGTGGNGGQILLVYNSYTNNGTVAASGGAGGGAGSGGAGTGTGGSGTNGSVGNAGTSTTARLFNISL